MTGCFNFAPILLSDPQEDIFNPNDTIVAALLTTDGHVVTTCDFDYADLDQALDFVKTNRWTQIVHQKTGIILFHAHALAYQ